MKLVYYTNYLRISRICKIGFSNYTDTHQNRLDKVSESSLDTTSSEIFVYKGLAVRLEHKVYKRGLELN